MPPATTSASAARAREQLLEMLSPLVAAEGYDLEDITVSSAGRRSLVRITVDSDGGIDLDAVAVISRIASDALDADAADSAAGRVLTGSFTLEVSSPGVDRPLTEPRHWRRAAGRLVATTVDGTAVTGRVSAVHDTGVLLEVAGDSRTAKWEQLGKGKVQVEFNRAETNADTEADTDAEPGRR